MNVLITGGAGFIGSNLVDRLQSRHQVVVFDDFNDFYDPSIKERNTSGFQASVQIVRGDLVDATAVKALFDEYGPFDQIVHLGARAGVRPSIQSPQLYLDTNVTGTLHLLEAIRRAGKGKFVFASSSSVYGLAELPFTESMALTQTISPYAATKLAAEQLCATYAHLYQIPTVALRFFTVYGPRQRPDLAIHKFAKKMLAGESIPVFGDGSTRRDYTFVSDIIDGIEAAMAYQGPIFDIFNLGESQTIQLSELIATLESVLGCEAQIDRQAEQPGDVPATWADITKARQRLGYAPSTTLREGLEQFATWLREEQPRLASPSTSGT